MNSLKLSLIYQILLYCGFNSPLEAFRIRSKRFLIFPRQAPTRHQFIGGIGIPADLPYESVTMGHVLKAEFWLPYNATVFRENPIFPEYNNTIITARNMLEQKSALRWFIYGFIENRLYSYGYDGHSCMLKMICDASSMLFARHNGVFEELMHILFTPSSSKDLPTVDSHKYEAAESLAHAGGDCNTYNCNIAPLDWISSVLKARKG